MIADALRAAPSDVLEMGYAERVATFEREILSEALEQARSNQTEAARRLGLSYHQLRRLTAKHNLRR